MSRPLDPQLPDPRGAAVAAGQFQDHPEVARAGALTGCLVGLEGIVRGDLGPGPLPAGGPPVQRERRRVRGQRALDGSGGVSSEPDGPGAPGGGAGGGGSATSSSSLVRKRAATAVPGRMQASRNIPPPAGPVRPESSR